MTNQELRDSFLVENLFETEKINLTYTLYDRMVIGGIVPVQEPINLPNPDGLKANYFLERRELGIINIGGAGQILVDNSEYDLGKLDCLYIGKGVKEVQFSSVDTQNPALYYLLSSPAHCEFPTKLMKMKEANPVALGSIETSNQRVIYQYIHQEGLKSCQLVMGLTLLQIGNTWNTMPPHTHNRRMEAYLYFDVPDNQRVLHLMGQPKDTRHLWMSNLQAVISPPWSIHAGCGTSNYGFIWGMAGENQAFNDMDLINIHDL
jgi:4-deoxy-L-threo-5-hexosulose-uronate ketol-isomerase